MFANVTMAFQNAATTGEGLTQFLPERRRVTFRVTGNGPVTGGAVTIECCPGTPMTTTTVDTGRGIRLGSRLDSVDHDYHSG